MTFTEEFLSQPDLSEEDEHLIRLTFLEGWSKQRLGYPQHATVERPVTLLIVSEGFSAAKVEQDRQKEQNR